jgi:small subunit ribosomal protein S17
MARKSKDTNEAEADAAPDAEQALETVEAEAAAELPADGTTDADADADAAAKAAARDAERALEAVAAEAAAELPADDVEAAVPVSGGGASAAPKPSEAAGGARPNRRKVREGIVVSDAMTSTVVVAVVERVRHPKYGKTVQRTKKLYVHDAQDTAKVGDRVRVQETRPVSKLKRWRLTEVLERAR